MRVKSVIREPEWCRTTVWFENNGVSWSRYLYDYLLKDEIGMKSWLNSLIEDVKIRTLISQQRHGAEKLDWYFD